MKKLEDFADDINKCSKCGLCQSVCPVYKITGNDCAVSRGKFVMLDGVLKGDLKLNKNIEKYLDMCLKCGKCKDFCPSNIDVCEIFNTAKYECAKSTFHGKVEKFLESKWVFGNVLKIFKFFVQCSAGFKPLTRDYVPPSPSRGEGIESFSSLQPCNSATVRLLYFQGCVNTVYPKTERAFKKICAHLDNVVIIERDFDCCGLPFLSCGNMERFEEVKKHNLQLIESCDFDYILTDCASCESTLKGYMNPSHQEIEYEQSSAVENPSSKSKISVLPQGEDKNLKINCNKKLTMPLPKEEKASLVREVSRSDGGFSFVNAAEFLAGQDITFKFKKPVKVTFHKPCHLENDDFLKPLLEKCKNVEYVEMKDYDECCGFAGEFAIKNPKISREISKQKALNAYETGADYILTTCPACVMGLHQGFLAAGKKAPKIMNIIEFLSLAEVEGK